MNDNACLVGRLRQYDSGFELSRPLDAAGTYVITGGLSGIGLAVAEYYVGLGIHSLALLSRRKPDDALLEKISRWKEQGVHNAVYSVDVSNMIELTRVFDELRNLPLVIKGVIHSAGLLADSVIMNQTSEKYQSVFAA